MEKLSQVSNLQKYEFKKYMGAKYFEKPKYYNEFTNDENAETVYDVP